MTTALPTTDRDASVRATLARLDALDAALPPEERTALHVAWCQIGWELDADVRGGETFLAYCRRHTVSEAWPATAAYLRAHGLDAAPAGCA